jgi:hypothetical protein
MKISQQVAESQSNSPNRKRVSHDNGDAENGDLERVHNRLSIIRTEVQYAEIQIEWRFVWLLVADFSLSRQT